MATHEATTQATSKSTEAILEHLSTPEDGGEYPLATAEVARVDGTEVWRMTFEPGWHWKEHLGPIQGTETCREDHRVWVMLSGQLVVRMDDGTTVEFGPDDIGRIPPGHDAWVAGDEQVVALEVKQGVDAP